MQRSRATPVCSEAALCRTLVGAIALVILGCASSLDPLTPDAVPPPSRPSIAWVTMVPNDAAVAVGDTIRVRVVETNIGPVARIAWQTSDTGRAVVDSAGLVLAKAAGAVAVRATAYSAAGNAASGAVTLRIE